MMLKKTKDSSKKIIMSQCTCNGTISFIKLYLGLILLCTTNDSQLINWWKNELILWKLSSISMKIWNDMQLELNSNLIEKKWDANWCIRYWKFACEYGVQKKN
jgi:hypothetical protein